MIYICVGYIMYNHYIIIAKLEYWETKSINVSKIYGESYDPLILVSVVF